MNRRTGVLLAFIWVAMATSSAQTPASAPVAISITPAASPIALPTPPASTPLPVVSPPIVAPESPPQATPIPAPVQSPPVPAPEVGNPPPVIAPALAPPAKAPAPSKTKGKNAPAPAPKRLGPPAPPVGSLKPNDPITPSPTAANDQSNGAEKLVTMQKLIGSLTIGGGAFLALLFLF